MVSDNPLDGNCNADLDRGFCEGRPMDNGRCYRHGGRHEDDDRDPGGAPDENTNSVSHGAYAEQSDLYSKEFSDREQDLTDRIFQDYLELYQSRHGVEPPAGHKIRLFRVAVNTVTEMRVENWYTEKPDELDTGSDAPHIDRETHISESGQRYYRYKKSPAVAAIKHLEGYNRKWLKELGLLPDDGADVEVNLQSELWENLTGYYEAQEQ